MEVHFVEGDQSADRRKFRAVSVVVLMLVALPSIALRAFSTDMIPVWVFVPLFLAVPVGLGSFGARWLDTRSRLRKSGSAKYVFVRGNIEKLRLQFDDDDSEPASIKDLQQEYRIMLLVDMDPPRLEAVTAFGMGGRGGRISLSPDSVATVWHQGRRVRSVEIVEGNTRVLLEGHGKVAGWATT